MMTKYDFLVTEVQDKLAETIRLLQQYGEIDKNLSIREVYNKYLHPSVLPLDDKNIWKVLQENSVLNIFQFDSDVGSQAAKKIRPNSILEMSDANGLMRLMTAEKNQESPMEKYIRYKNDISLWYKEMDEYGLTKEEQKVVEPYFKSSYGVPPSQEQLMMMLMDENICHFTLAEANAARKIVGKKQMSKIPELREKVLNQAASPCLGNYIWRCGVGPQMGYSFSTIHALAYSFIGFQTMFIATRWNPIYWDTACLIVNSGSLEDNSEEEIVGIYEPEYQEMLDGTTFEDLPDRSGKIKRTSATDYAKIAKALGDIIGRGIKISLVDINKSSYGFEPDVENNQILFGMKALNNVGEPVIKVILAGRPYYSFKDFLNRCPLNKSAMISLIKSGAFDKLEEDWAKELNVEPRILIMAYYLYLTSDLKKKLNLQNFNGLLQKEIIPTDKLEFQIKTFLFNKYLKANRKVGKYYTFDNPCLTFYEENFASYKMEIINNCPCILQTEWDKIYQKEMDVVRDWLKDNQEEALKRYNFILFKEAWDKYAKGNISAWEMESLCFYYHPHELSNLNVEQYGLSLFDELPETPEVDYFFKRNGKNIPIYKLHKIVGTVISKNDSHSSISILTTTGVVTVKFTKEYFAMYGRQISEKQADGTRKVMEKGWFQRGTKVLCTGFRREDTFVCKTYKNTPTHQLYQIVDVKDDGTMQLVHERYKVEDKES